MAAFVSLHQKQQLILINVETVQAVTPMPLYRANGSEIRLTDSTAISVDESVQEIEALL